MNGETPKAGQAWSSDELDLIVAEYFAMLGEQFAGRTFVKRHRSVALSEALGRARSSIELKHCNVSAILTELALPTLDGYSPLYNIQRALIPAVERFVTSSPGVLTPTAAEQPALQFAERASLFVEPAPALQQAQGEPSDAELQRLVRKFDPVERDFRNRTLGRAGEAIIFEHERDRLGQVGRADLARKVRWVSEEDGDGAGYDIHSFAEDGRERLLEVKTTNGVNTTPFFLTRNERTVSDERADAFRLVRVFDFARQPRVFELEPPLQHSVILTAENWRASFQ